MSWKSYAVAAGIGMIGLAVTPLLAADDHHTVVPADQVEWKAGPPTLPGSELAVLLGSPAEEGPFVIRFRFPSGYEVPPHWHSKDEHLTIIAGAFGIGTGETLDRGAAPLLAPGSFVRIAAGMPHFAWTEEGAVVQINGTGPFDVNFVNAEDDPRG